MGARNLGLGVGFHESLTTSLLGNGRRFDWGLGFVDGSSDLTSPEVPVPSPILIRLGKGLAHCLLV